MFTNDIAKAFGTMNQSILINKLYNVGIRAITLLTATYEGGLKSLRHQHEDSSTRK